MKRLFNTIDEWKIIQDKIEVAYNGKDDDLIPIEKLIAREYIKRKYGIENYKRL